MQINGTNFGMDFNTLYRVQQDAGLTNNTTLSHSSPLYNQFQVMFKGKQTDNISRFNQNDIFLQTGLKQNPDKMGWIG